MISKTCFFFLLFYSLTWRYSELKFSSWRFLKLLSLPLLSVENIRMNNSP